MVFIRSSKNQAWILPPDIRDLIPSRTDTYQLKPQIELVEENCGLLKEGTKICADSG
jgi:hypothetical protein